MANDLELETCCGESLPESMTIGRGGLVATCWACGYKSGLWECACELVHDCESGGE